ncbi:MULTISPECIES: M48 family metalloprotease [Streptacidiphilus]|uniref:M48 family metalloprotease n=1 Tax=Streptacidiphilus cavernicola TaxID=3342716 RepID=A0ABV6UWT0_9ACTN|nr:M48 family metallopeptidase [Streptacidiphilus jeojiense]
MRASLPAVRALALLLCFYLITVGALAAIVGLDIGLTAASNHQGGLALVETWGVSLVLAYPLVRGLLVGLSGSRTRRSGVRVRPGDQPRLWQRVERTAQAMGVRPPAEIWLVDHPQAAVSQDSRLLGLVPGRRRMVLGLPLLHGLTASELDAVVAHELGHFAHGDTRLSALTTRNRAGLQQVLSRYSSEDGGPGQWLNGVFAGYARFCLRSSQATARRQELAADTAAARFAGPDALIGTLRATVTMTRAHHGYLSGFRDIGRELGLAPQADQVYPGFQAFLQSGSWRQEQDRLTDDPPGARQSPYDSHPPMAERIERLRQLPARDACAADPTPAHTLLDRPTETCAMVVASRPGAADQREVDWDTLAAAAGRAELDRETAGLRDAARAILRRRPDQLPALLDAVDEGRWKEIADWMPREGMSRTVSSDAGRSMTESAAADALYSWALTTLVDQGRGRWLLNWDQGHHLDLDPGLDATLGPALDTALDPGARDTTPLRRLLRLDQQVSP